VILGMPYGLNESVQRYIDRGPFFGGGVELSHLRRSG